MSYAEMKYGGIFHYFRTCDPFITWYEISTSSMLALDI